MTSVPALRSGSRAANGCRGRGRCWTGSAPAVDGDLPQLLAEQAVRCDLDEQRPQVRLECRPLLTEQVGRGAGQRVDGGDELVDGTYDNLAGDVDRLLVAEAGSEERPFTSVRRIQCNDWAKVTARNIPRPPGSSAPRS